MFWIFEQLNDTINAAIKGERQRFQPTLFVGDF